ncbi:DUF3866 family protein [Alteribacter aurantiacus]|uniref:DUF3866 family protein n=1 Tax=Alteribacter aurantiacus TaxID=254410 RepID=UPI0003FD99C5|nr:DUF3866 family protein [Alteribacter aurantiacus]
MLCTKNVTVTKIINETNDIQTLTVDGGCGSAVLYKAYFPRVEPGDKVKINVTATQLNLGTGGFDFVMNVEDRKSHSIGEQKGHIIKGRYLPIQHSMLTVESPEQHLEAPYFNQKLNLNGKPILLCELHSMLPVLWGLFEENDKEGNLIAIIDDSAALALPVSNHLQSLKTNSRMATISIGQAFGGDFEAINLVTALQFVMNIDPKATVVVTVGPGGVGTATRYGFSAIRMAEWANIIGKGNGNPIWTPRLSEADKRERHLGLSHHTMTALTEFTYAKSVLTLPVGEQADRYLMESVKKLEQFSHVEVIKVCENLIKEWVERSLSNTGPIHSMGRSFQEDPLYFSGVGTALYYLFEYEKKRAFR